MLTRRASAKCPSVLISVCPLDCSIAAPALEACGRVVLSISARKSFQAR